MRRRGWTRCCGRARRLLYKLTGVDEKREMRWTEYAIAMLLFSGVSMTLLYVIERVQQWLPWNPQKLAAVPTDLAFNTAASFTTNTNWQAYTPGSHDDLFHADGGVGLPQFPIGGGGYRAGDRGDSRSRAARAGDHRQFLGGPDADDFVGAAAGVFGGCDDFCVAGHDSEFAAVHDTRSWWMRRR